MYAKKNYPTDAGIVSIVLLPAPFTHPTHASALPPSETRFSKYLKSE